MLLTDIYTNSQIVEKINSLIHSSEDRIHVHGMTGSLSAIVAATIALLNPDRDQLIIAGNKEEAYYMLNDIEMLLEETDADFDQKRALLFPSSYRKPRRKSPQSGAPDLPPQVDDDGGDLLTTDNANILQRSEVVKQLNSGRSMTIVTYPEALYEKVVSSRTLTRNTLRLTKGTDTDIDFIVDIMQEYEFDRVDFVVEPGQYAVRGGIVDVFSFANEHPYRIEFFDTTIESLRTFDPVTQLSIKQYDQISILAVFH